MALNSRKRKIMMKRVIMYLPKDLMNRELVNFDGLRNLFDEFVIAYEGGRLLFLAKKDRLAYKIVLRE